MLSVLFAAPARVQALRSGPFGLELEGFAEYLCQHGYSKISARRHLRSAEHFAHWAHRQGLSVDSFNANTTSCFDRHLSRCRCKRFGCADRGNVLVGVRMFITSATGVNRHTVRTAIKAECQFPIFLEFCKWMREQRATTEATLYNYSTPISSLIERCGGDLNALDAQCLHNLVLESCGGRSLEAAKLCTTALRMFLRFLIAEGRCPARLLPAVPAVAHRRLSSVPRVMSPNDGRCPSGSCNRRRCGARYAAFIGSST
jgi:hypothetical protein